METGREVLQLLNDRINQTIEAINQVRTLVHGLQGNVYSQFAGGNIPYGQGVGLSHTGTPYGQGTFGFVPWNMQQFQNPMLTNPWLSQMGIPFVPGVSQGFQGLSHTGISPLSVLGQNPLAMSLGYHPGFGQQGFGQQGFGQQSFGQPTIDPFTLARIVQSIPFNTQMRSW
jgi:hypothetical protein